MIWNECMPIFNASSFFLTYVWAVGSARIWIDIGKSSETGIGTPGLVIIIMRSVLKQSPYSIMTVNHTLIDVLPKSQY